MALRSKAAASFGSVLPGFAKVLAARFIYFNNKAEVSLRLLPCLCRVISTDSCVTNDVVDRVLA